MREIINKRPNMFNMLDERLSFLLGCDPQKIDISMSIKTN